MSLKPEEIIIMQKYVAIKWSDDTESFLSNKILRDSCPCAHCSGESDVFGNVYKGEKQKLKDNKEKQFLINRYINIGHYAIRIVWQDGHSGGIYSYNLLKSFDDSK